MTDLERLLVQIEAQCRIAREALADEHEGNVTAAVAHIVDDATRLDNLVGEW